jgi:hypothetical protein
MFGYAKGNLARIFFAIALLASIGVLAPSATAAPQKVSYEDAVPGLAPIGASMNVIPSGSERDLDAQQALSCTPGSHADNPHLSSTPGVISGHGWWTQGDCDNNRATVTNCLYEYYTDGTWRRKACDTEPGIYPGGGSANRSAANRQCDSTGQAISWRNRVDVDVDDEWDSSEVFERQATVNCVVTGPDQ